MKEGRPPLPPLKSSPFSKVGSIIFERPPIFFCYEPQTWHNEIKVNNIHVKNASAVDQNSGLSSNKYFYAAWSHLPGIRFT